MRPVAIGNEPRLGLWTIDLTTGHVDALIGDGTHGAHIEVKFLEAEMAFAALVVRTCVQFLGAGNSVCGYFYEQFTVIANMLLKWAYRVIGSPCHGLSRHRREDDRRTGGRSAPSRSAAKANYREAHVTTPLP